VLLLPLQNVGTVEFKDVGAVLNVLTVIVTLAEDATMAVHGLDVPSALK
jgi:hypothetical protein